MLSIMVRLEFVLIYFSAQLEFLELPKVYIYLEREKKTENALAVKRVFLPFTTA